jgi:hypothetical protein
MGRVGVVIFGVKYFWLGEEQLREWNMCQKEIEDG